MSCQYTSTIAWGWFDRWMQKEHMSIAGRSLGAQNGDIFEKRGWMCGQWWFKDLIYLHEYVIYSVCEDIPIFPGLADFMKYAKMLSNEGFIYSASVLQKVIVCKSLPRLLPCHPGEVRFGKENDASAPLRIMVIHRASKKLEGLPSSMANLLMIR